MIYGIVDPMQDPKSYSYTLISTNWQNCLLIYFNAEHFAEGRIFRAISFAFIDVDKSCFLT